MFRALRFFISNGWKYDKLYVIEKILYQLASALLPIVLTIMPKYIIDELTGAGRPERLVFYVAFLAGFALFSNAASAYLVKDAFTHRIRVDAAFSLDIHRMLAAADYQNLESPAFLEMQKRAEKFLSCDWHGFGYLLDCALDACGQMVTLAGIAAVVATMNPLMILLFAILSFLGALSENRAKRRALALNERIIAAQRYWLYYARLFEDYRFGKEIRQNGIADWLLARERHFLDQSICAHKEQNDAFIRSGVLGAVLGFIQHGAVYAYLCVRVLTGTLGIGDFVLYASAATAFFMALRKTLDAISEVRAYDPYFDDLDRYLNMPATMRDGKCLPLPAGRNLEFRNVGFRYAGQETWALRGVNISIRAGERLSVVGENGAGKSTFAKLLLRLIDPTEGAILMDGVDIRDIDVEKYRAAFAAVFQDFKLFSFSLRYNVAFGEAGAEEALLRAGLGGKLTKLPNGIETTVGREFDEQGFEPSGGEAQKIALARALRRDASIVILDEPTAALDPRAEYELYQGFADLVKGKTAVFISHRLSSARFCDRIAVFKDGAIVELGSHQALRTANGLYRMLYDMQAQYYTQPIDSAAGK